MSIFANMKRTNDVEAPKDTLGGGGYIKESGVYDAVIKMAYAFTSAAGAQGISLEFKLKDESTYKERFYITKRTGEFTYERNGKTFYMPGYISVDELCAVATGQLLSDQPTTEKTIKVYDFQAGGEVDQEVPVMTDLVGKKVKIAIQKIIQFKSVKKDDGWKDSDEVQETNEISKSFDVNGFTVIELMDKAEETKFLDAWIEKNEGVSYDKTKGKTPKGSGVGSPKAGAVPKKTLFNK